MKTVLKLTLCLALALCTHFAHAQYFDWVKTYQSTHSSGAAEDKDNMICDMCTDSRGNVYFIGACVRGAAINGEELLWEVNHAEHSHNRRSTCIVKMSPSGEMLWHKAISDWSGRGSGGLMQMVGDSAVVCYVGAPRPTDANNPVFWLDSLIQYPDWVLPGDSIGYLSYALLTFDLDGNLREQHFLNVGFLDSLGVPLVEDPYTPVLADQVAAEYLLTQCFHIDHEGNIILGVGCGGDKGYRKVRCDTCERPVHTVTYTVEDGGVGAVRIMVDGTRSLFYYPENRPILTNAKLMKFSPHFDSLLEVRYLMQSRLDSPRTGYGVPGITDSKIYHITSDPEGNLYAVGCIDVLRTDSIVPIDSAQGLTLHLKDQTTGFIIKYDTQLQPVYVKQLEGGNIRRFLHCAIKDDDLFVLGGGGSTNLSETFFYGTEELHDIAGGMIFLRLDKRDGQLISYGKARPSFDNEAWASVTYKISPTHTKFAVHNNRIVTQPQFRGNIAFAGDIACSPEAPYWGMGAVMWDYDGHQLAINNFNAPNPDNIPVDVLFTDSSLYFSGMFIGQATFGDTSFNVSHSNAYLARYVDTAFLHPYVHTETPDTGNVRIQLADDGGAFVAYPNPFRQRININYNGTDAIVSAYLTDMAGRREEVRLQGVPADNNGPACYSLDLTSRPQATYLLTLVTASGRQHTLRLFKQSDIFGN